MTKIEEIWLPINGYEKYYKISNLGRIYSFINNKDLKPWKNRKGYLFVKLFNLDLGVNKTISIHRLVALNFICNPDDKPQVNHINGIKTDNRVENLEWCTCKENICAAYNTGIKSNKGEKHPKSIFKNQDILNIRYLSSMGVRNHLIAKQYKCGNDTIYAILKRKNWSHI